MKILNFGSLNYDLCYDVDHFTQAGETQSSLGFTRTLGGKGFNQSVALARAGLYVYHAGCVGSDGDGLKDFLKKENVDISLLKTDVTAATGHAVIQIAGGNNCILLYGGANQTIESTYVDEVLKHFEAGDLLVLQNEISSLPYLITKAHEKGMKIVMNTAPMNANVLACPLQYIDLLIVNEIEGRGLAESDAETNEAAAYVLSAKFPRHHILMTCGSEGARYIANGDITFVPAPKVTPVDTTGAGDTFTGFFLAAKLNGLSIEDSLKRATAASVLSIMKNGAAISIPAATEVDAYLASHAQ